MMIDTGVDITLQPTCRSSPQVAASRAAASCDAPQRRTAAPARRKRPPPPACTIHMHFR